LFLFDIEFLDKKKGLHDCKPSYDFKYFKLIKHMPQHRALIALRMMMMAML